MSSGRRRSAPALCAALALAMGQAASGAPGASPDEIVIGLIVPQSGQGARAGREALCGSEAAVRRAQAEGGTSARSIRLVTAASGHPWEDAAPRVARLIHDEGASIVMGGLDAATAHSAEQVILRERGRAAFISIWASESALTQLPVPWYFSIVPEDRLQGRALAREIFDVRGARGAAVLADGSREGRSAASAFENAAPPGAVLRFASEDPGAADRMAAAIRERSIQAVVLAAGPEASARVARRLSGVSPRVPIFGSLRLATAAFARPAQGRPDAIAVPWPAPADARAAGLVREACGVPPGDAIPPLALYAHDAAAAALAALASTGGPGGQPLERRLAAVSFAGATGPVGFDAATRSRRDMPAFIPVALEPPTGDAGSP